MFTQRFLVSLCAVLPGMAFLLSATAVTWAQPLAIEYAGIVAPGTGGKTFYSSVLPYRPVANGGSIVFEAQTTDFNYGLWRWQGGALSKIIYAGDPIPGVSGSSFLSPNEFTANSQGLAAFSTFQGLTIETPTGLVSVAKTGDTAPGTSGTFFGFQDLSYTSNGEISFRGQVQGGPASFGVWRATTTLVAPVAIDGQSISSSQSITNTDSFAPPAAGNGATTFAATVGPGNLNAIVRQAGGSAPQVIALQGQPAPNLPTETYSSFSDPVANNAGQVAFRAGLSNGDVFNAIFRDLGSGPKFVIGNGSPMPGPAGAKLDGLSDPVINQAGILAFTGYLDAFSVPLNTGLEALWTIDTFGTIHEIARAGNSVPGVSGAQFGDFIGVPFQMNHTNQIAFLATINGASTNNDSGIWATDKNGNLVLVVREGEQVQVSPGVFRTVRSISFVDSSQSNGAESAWTDQSYLAYTLNFTDSTSGIFISAVPEPSSLLLAALGVASLLGCSTWRRSASSRKKKRCAERNGDSADPSAQRS